MAYKSLAQLRVLIVDDFDNFRVTLKKMMVDLGVTKVNACGSAVDALTLCENNEYDLVLCDYNLGAGKTGQQLLEELRFYSLLATDTIFVMVSAETDRSIVMSTYDYKPDAYLTKPVTTKMLRQRLDRLLSERDEFSGVNEAMSSQQFSKAITLLNAMMSEKSGRSITYRKILAHAYLMNGDYDGAEAEYSTILQTRRLDWAQVGLAKIKCVQEDYSTAAGWLEGIVLESPACIEAFDLLVTVYDKLDFKQKKQKVLNKLVQLSPMSVARQLKLAQSAMTNYDFKTAAKTYAKAMKLGHQSCHQSRDTHMNYLRAMIAVMDQEPTKDKAVLKKLVAVLNNANKLFTANNSQQENQQNCQSLLFYSQINCHSGEPEMALKQLKEAHALLKGKDCDELQLQLDFVSTLMVNNRVEDARVKLKVLTKEHKSNVLVYPKIDRLHFEPSLASHRKLISQYNKKGIGLYQAKEFDKAITCFKEVAIKFPNHIGTKLNFLQTIIGKLKVQGKELPLIHQCRDFFECLSTLINTENEQYQRYLQLRNVFHGLSG